MFTPPPIDNLFLSHFSKPSLSEFRAKSAKLTGAVASALLLLGGIAGSVQAGVVADGAGTEVNGNEQFPTGEILSGSKGVHGNNGGSASLTTDTVTIKVTESAVRAESGGSATVGNENSAVNLTAESASAGRPTAIYANNTGSILVQGDSVQAKGVSSVDYEFTRALYAGNNSTVTVNANNIVLEGKHNKTGTSARAYVVHSVGSVVNIGTSDSDYVELRALATTEANDGNNTSRTSRVIFASGGEVNVAGQEILLSVSGYEAIGTAADQGASISLGSENSTLDIDVSGTTMAIGLRAEGDENDGAASIVLTGSSVNINALSGNGTGIGLMALNNTESSERPQETTTIEIDSDSASITADGVGISAYSNSEVLLNTALKLSAPTAIEARGNSLVTVYADDQERTVQIDGDISFATTKEGSGQKLNADVQINLRGDDSYWTGNVKMDYPNDLSVDNQEISQGVTLALADGAAWNATVIEDSSDESNKTEAIALHNLTLENGVVNATKVDQTVSVNNLTMTEKGGTFNAVTTQNEDGGFASSKLSVQNSQVSDGAVLTVNYTGITADELTEKNVADLAAVNVDGLATTEVVEEGDVKGAWVRTTSATGEESTRQSENTKLESFKGVNAAALVQWRNQINHLTKRLGDVRQQSGDIGAWARVYGGEYKWGDANRVDMTSTTVQVGGDARMGDWIVGGAFSYSDSNFDVDNGDGDGDLYSLAVYGTRTFEKGSYVDFVARYGYLKNDIKVGNMDVDFDSNAFSLSVEGGHTFKFMERAYIEPQIQLTYGFTEGDNATASNGVKIEQDDYQNLITRIGLRTGFDFPNDAGTIYAHASYSYDFLGEADGTASKDQVRASLDEDLGGGWVTYGIGSQFRLGERTFAYGEIERSTGGDVENPWAFNIGFRHLF